MRNPAISIVTPWLNHPEFIEGYEKATKGANEIIIVDTGSEEANFVSLCDMVKRQPDKWGIYNYSGEKGFANWCNFGASRCWYNHPEDVVVFLNNDIEGTPDWLEDVRQIPPRELWGAALNVQHVDGVPCYYVEGWAIAARVATWQELGWWNTNYKGGYWEDNDLSLRAVMRGMKLRKREWSLRHLSNGTSKTTPGAYAHSLENQQKFVASVKEAMQS